ncbi:hypothetical protein M407DRAFT_222281 [Tulasnella calospora MUT 4182]|uniref:PH domain-containing protein n=1 Tax=Tulasnella calospora MUT 4182 TaxID=1051891 RepID=A0A0C3PXB2_9AGAM|nr:hypothetical protein M407DRAFT_222281 [Tulasnella calospora MUT 4182]
MNAATPASISRYPSTSTTSRSFLGGGRSRTTSETTASERLPETMKPKSSGTSVWSNDGDPFAAIPPTTSVQRSTSVRSTSPPTRRNTPTMIGSTGIAGGASAAQQPQKKRMSLLLTATSDALFSGFGSRKQTNNLRGSTSKPTSVKKQYSIDEDADMSPVLDIRAPPSTILQKGPGFTDEEAEREALRHEAARSVGLTSTTISPPPPDLPEEDESYSQDASYEFIRRPSAPHSLSGALSPDHASSYAAASSTLATMRSAASSQASLSVETTHQVPITPSRPLPSSIPNYPATLAALSPFATTSSTLMRHYSGSTFFLGKARQWKSRHIVLTSFKPPPKPNAPDVEPDTQSHLHLFRNFASEEKELERMKIDEDSVVFVVEDDPVTQGRKNVIRIGGRHAGGGGSHSAVGGRTTRLAPPSAMASLSVMGAPAMAVQMGGQLDFKVVWLLQCPDSQTMHQWIASVKGALLVQRAERAGLGMSMQSGPGDRLTGDIDVILSLRAQGYMNQPSSPTSPTRYVTSPVSASSVAPPVEDLHQPVTRGGRSRSSTTTNAPSAAVNALKGLFTSSVANGPTNGTGGGLASRPRSISSVASTPIPMASPVKKPTPLEEDPKDSSFGTRANAMLNMHLSRSTNGHGQPPSSGSSLILDRSIRDSLISTPYYDESMEMDFESKQKDNRERLNALAAFAAATAASSSAGSYERPPSLSSLPPPPRTKRPGSSAGPGQQQNQLQQQQTPRTPVFEKDMQDELKKAMFAPVLEMAPSSRSRTNSLRRNSTDTIPEEDDVGSSVGVGGGRGSSLGRHGVAREVLSIRTSIDEQGRVSIESSNRGEDLYSAAAIPFPGPGSLLPPADLDNGAGAAGGTIARSQFGPAGMKSSASFGVDLIHAGQQPQPTYGSHHAHHPSYGQHQYHRPASAMSSVSTNSFHGNGSATPGASDHMSLHMSPRSGTSSSEGRGKPGTAPPPSTGPRSPSSPQRSRRVPKVMIPPPAPPPSAPLPGTPKTEMNKALHPEDASVSTKERDSRSSFFASKRVSAASSTGVSIRSFTSGSSSSRSGSVLQRSGIHPAPPRPPPTFALPPTPSPLTTGGLTDSPQFDGYSLRDSVRSTHRTSLNSNHSQSHSPTRSDFGAVGTSAGTNMGTSTMGKRLLHRLTPPSNPPPTGALPPRPDSDEPPHSPLSHRSGSSGSVSGLHQQQQNYHHRSSSIISNGGGVLSTIPASPVDKLPEATQPPMMGLPLSPPPARRGSRLSKDLGWSGIARVNAALALDSAPLTSNQPPPVSETDDVDPLDPAVEHWEPSRRESVMIPL